MAKSPKRRAWLRWSIAACLVFLLLLGWELVSSMKQLNALEADRQAAQEQLDEIEQRNDTLEKQIELSQTDEYIIRMARQLLGWVFPGEIRIIEGTDP